jgi:hypothetical protein
MLAAIPTDSTEPIMTIAEVLLQDFEPEAINTSMTLERIPEDKPDFRPHPKSMPSGRSRPM